MKPFKLTFWRVRLQSAPHCSERYIAGPTGWVWKSVDIPPIWDKENTDPRPAVNESQPQQMCLGAWQQLMLRVKSTANHSRDENDRQVRRPNALKPKMTARTLRCCVSPSVGCCALGVWECVVCLGKVLASDNRAHGGSLEPGVFLLARIKVTRARRHSAHWTQRPALPTSSNRQKSAVFADTERKK